MKKSKIYRMFSALRHYHHLPVEDIFRDAHPRGSREQMMVDAWIATQNLHNFHDRPAQRYRNR